MTNTHVLSKAGDAIVDITIAGRAEEEVEMEKESREGTT